MECLSLTAFQWTCLTSDATTLKAAIRPHVFATLVAIGTELLKAFAEYEAIFVSATCKENMHESWNNGLARPPLKLLQTDKIEPLQIGNTEVKKIKSACKPTGR